MEETKYCYRCNSEMELIKSEPAEWDEDVTEIVYKCPYCGATHTATTPNKDSQKDYPYYNEEQEDSVPDVSHGYDGYCLQCGSHIVWQSDFMRSEVWGDVNYTPEAQARMDEIVDELAIIQDKILKAKEANEDFSEYVEQKNTLGREYADLQYDGIDENDDSLASYCVCPHCGTYHEIVDAKPSEYKDYPKYQEDNDDN